MPLRIPATFRDVPSKIEGVIPGHRNVRYVYYNEIPGQNTKSNKQVTLAPTTTVKSKISM